ncbi:hypothetical protein [Blastococcus deserti]|uniref:Uncharacterized protein n=1 Tax=Blastococcus deserti TaxID=2259033 RepID=A0ABW4XEG8_9ACTN
MPIALLVGGLALAGLGAFLVTLGCHDFVLATRREERLIGGALAASGAAGLIAAYLVLHRRSGWALRGLATVSALGGLVLVSIQASFQSSPRLWLWAALVALPFLALWLGERALARAERAVGPRGVPEQSRKPEIAATVVAASATVLGSLIGLMGGAFTPLVSPSTLDVDVRLSTVGHRVDPEGREFALVDTAVTMENIGRQRLVFFGSAYIVQGYRSEIRSSSGQADWPLDDEVARDNWSGRYERPVVLEPIELGYDLVNPGDYLEPGQTLTSNWVTPVPRDEVNTVEGWVLVATGYEQRLRLGRQLLSAQDDDLSSEEGAVASWEILPTSWIAQLTRGRQSVSVQYEVTRAEETQTTGGVGPVRPIDGISISYRIGPGGPADASSSRRSPGEYSERIANFYGAGGTVGTAAVVLDQE